MNPLDIPAERANALRELLVHLQNSTHVLLSTHVNADGDGAGSEAAMACWLAGLGKTVHVVNPTPFPDMFMFLLHDVNVLLDPSTQAAAEPMKTADTLLVLDTGDPKRIGKVASARAGKRVIVIDHHLASETGFEGNVLQDKDAAATGELVYDLLQLAEAPRPWARSIINGIYAAILTDTGSFRFSNTSPRALAIAGDLLAQGVNPEEMYRRIYATVPLRRIELLRHALDHLEVHPALPITWITIDRALMERLGCTTDDLDGVVEHARSIEGTEVALLFRATTDGSTKISLRSSGDIDVNAIARGLGGGGHAKASGAVVNKPLPAARTLVIEAVAAALEKAGFPLEPQVR